MNYGGSKRGAIRHIAKELGEFIESKSSTFACGGAIPLKATENDTANTGTALRWDSATSPNGITKIVFPVEGDEPHDSFAKLIADCQPASFGYKGQDILDDTYRKATKMDRSAFSIDFCPYEHGIVDTITQLLLPNASHVLTNGVKAELYKLNIYGAPSGFSKAHVDTPRSDTQFGSLVVSLPCRHVGGQLIVRHAEQSVTFDWGTPASSESLMSSINWAAFYSDCEHEVLEVTEGHRITLTYNLYVTSGVGNLAGNSPVMDVTSLPLYQKIEEALKEPTFITEGGYLGIGCEHAYAHSTNEGILSLPGALKGSDMAVYSVFLALGLQISIRQILDIREDYYPGFDEELSSYAEDPGLILEENLGNYEIERIEEYKKFMGKSFLSHNLYEVHVTETGGNEEHTSEILEELDGEWANVLWLTKPRHTNVQLAHLTYGNQAGIDYVYSRAALIVSVPSSFQRGAKGGFDTVSFA